MTTIDLLDKTVTKKVILGSEPSVQQAQLQPPSFHGPIELAPSPSKTQPVLSKKPGTSPETYRPIVTLYPNFKPPALPTIRLRLPLLSPPFLPPPSFQCDMLICSQVLE